VAAGSHAEIGRSLPHGHVALVWQVARQLGLPALLGPPGGSGTWRWRWWWQGAAASLQAGHHPLVGRHHLAVDLGVASASTDEVDAAMDWLQGRQDQIEQALARRHLEPGGLALFDLSCRMWRAGPASWRRGGFASSEGR
jgi:hypothetical protein